MPHSETPYRVPTNVIVTRHLIRTAPHVAYGKPELQVVINKAYSELHADGAVAGKCPGVEPILVALEITGALTVLRHENKFEHSAAYAEDDWFSISQLDEDDNPLSKERKPLSQWDALKLAKSAELVCDAIHDDLEPEVTEAEAIMFAVGSIFGGPADVTDADTSAYDLPFPDELTPEDISLVAEALAAVDDLDDVTEITTMRQFLIAQKAYQVGAEDGRKDVQVVAAPIDEPIVESTDDGYVRGFKAGYRDGFTDGRNF